MEGPPFRLMFCMEELWQRPHLQKDSFFSAEVPKVGLLHPFQKSEPSNSPLKKISFL